RKKLEQRIERHELNAAAGEDLCARNAVEDLVHHAFRSLVTITNGPLNQRPVSIDQSIIDGPAIDSTAANLTAEFATARARITQSFTDLIENACNIPPQMPRRRCRRRLKPPHL